MSKSKGAALRAIGKGRVRVLTYQSDWETRMISDPSNPNIVVPMVGTSLVVFMAEDFREVGEGTDLWEFKVTEETRQYLAYLSGEDIFMVYAPRMIG